MALTGKQAAFVREFIKDFNGTQAAIRAGYAKRGAHTEANRLLRKAEVQAELEKAQQRAAKRADITVDRIIEEYARVAFALMSDVASWGPDGVTFKDSSDLDPEVVAAIAEVSEDADKLGNRLLKVKLHSKLQALEKLGKHLGMFADKLEVKIQNAVESLLERVEHKLTPEAFAELVRAIEDELGLAEVAEGGEEEGDRSVH
ncbi:MAG: terminase small subunit [Candidatus Deferrimicrobiaceae bacterium]